MTIEELKNLPHLDIVDEKAPTLHIHCEKGYYLYTMEAFTNINDEGDEFEDYEMSGSLCYFFPIFEEYPTYKIITEDEYNTSKEKFDALTVEEKKLIYKAFNEEILKNEEIS